jgi:predicted nucleotidyltransferase component of viral defense system
MIPLTDIRAWGNVVPWKNVEQIEQDLVISRSLVEIYSDKYLSENLAFRGGTALNKIHFPTQPRYSEDIDLVQKNAGPIRDIITGLRNSISFLGEPKVKQKANNNTLIFRFDSENITPVPLRLKVEVNCREHFSVLGYHESAFSIDTRWFNGSARIQTYKLEELLGTKLRALYQRKKGRDLYDLYKAFSLSNPNPDDVLKCYASYLAYSKMKSPTKKQFINNLKEKLQDKVFIGDTASLLRPGEDYYPEEAFDVVNSILLEKL